MINIEYILFILLIIIILIFINFKNNEKFTSDPELAGPRIEGDPQKYIGPIIFLQQTNDGTTTMNCLGNTDEYRCIGKYPSDNNNGNGENYYPTDDELRYASQPNIINIPKGNDGEPGHVGSSGESATNNWFNINDRTNDAVIIGTNGEEQTFEIKGDSVEFNSNTNTIQGIVNMICIEEESADLPRNKFWEQWGYASSEGMLSWGTVPDDGDAVIANELEPLSKNCINRAIIDTLKTDYNKVFNV
tara:strand:- start:1066 stop:1803 length:738 start_codon:yes stop_codon:yes gene_type:complete